MADVDPINAVVKFLRSDSAIAARVETRIFSEELPQSESGSMPRQAIVVRSAGGGGIGQTNPIGDKRFDVRCYGSSPAEARALYSLAVHGALKRLRRVAVAESESAELFLHWARLSSDAISGRDPDTHWPYCLSVWQVLAGEVAA